MHNLSLTQDETQLVINALSAISPSGGGSSPFTLLRRLRESTGVMDQCEVVGSYQMTIHEEVESAING